MEKVSKTVYSYVYPETQRVIDELWENKPHHLYENPWTAWQDNYHVPFLNKWVDWVSPKAVIPNFKYSYISAGSSEAIRETLSKHAASGNKCIIHVFEGEYEGYEALAEPLGMRVVKHDRHDEGSWKSRLHAYNYSAKRDASEKHLFYISQPSAIDGNTWERYPAFQDWMFYNCTEIPIMLDLCYVGATSLNHRNKIHITPNVKTVFFSLSKVFGVYYHRIGGCFSRDPIENLYGNKWFKNMFSIKLGRELMDRFSIGELPAKYKDVQQEVISDLKDYNPEIRRSEVILLANSLERMVVNDEDNYYTRTTFHKEDIDYKINRYCITERIAEKVLVTA